jgi:hypothetical protein
MGGGLGGASGVIGGDGDGDVGTRKGLMEEEKKKKVGRSASDLERAIAELATEVRKLKAEKEESVADLVMGDTNEQKTEVNLDGNGELKLDEKELGKVEKTEEEMKKVVESLMADMKSMSVSNGE